jgi:lysophospholipase L1-like esterase
MRAMRRPAAALVATALALLTLAARPAAQNGPNPSRWEEEIKAFEQADLLNPPAHGSIIFTGSSSIRLWTSLQADFQGLPVLNRGFGGSMLPEVTAVLERIVIPHKPALVVLYCGTNDIHAGRSASQVVTDFETFVRTLHEAVPVTRIAYISIAPNPARWSELATQRAANRGIQEFIRDDARLAYIDVTAAMLGPDGLPKPDIYVEDGLHMNARGYALWTPLVRPYLELRRR